MCCTPLTVASLWHSSTGSAAPRGRLLPPASRSSGSTPERSNQLSLTGINIDFQACILECSLDVAKKRCGCTPWNYPTVLKESGSSICDVFGNYCFSQAMKSVTSKNVCDCPNDCRSFAYSVTVASSFLNEKIYCPKDAGLLKDFQGPLGLPKMFFSYYNLIVNKVK